MSATLILISDHQWFAAHPDRAFRVRPAVEWERARWPSPRPLHLVIKVLIRRADATSFMFGVSDVIDLDDYDDDELAGAFGDDLDRAAKAGGRT